jgi:GNAT superfamily N-acetyltransferase
MDEEYLIVYDAHPEKYAWGIIGEGINNYNAQQAGEEKAQRLCFVVQSPDKEIVGGVIGVIYWEWLYIDLMWIRQEYRRHGYGHRLLTQLEELARQRGAKHAFLDTFSFQAPEFYKKHGYRVYGELKDFPAGHQRYFMTKEL